MTADKFIDSLRPLLARRRTADALAEIEAELAAVRQWKDNPAITVVEIALIERERARIARLS